MTSYNAHNPRPDAASILSLHGGGYLGYFSARVAAALQARREASRVKGQLGRSFDAICGTSAGAIIAAGIATNVPPKQIVELMEEQGTKIFPRRALFSTAPGLWEARFDPAPLKSLLSDILGDVRLGEIDRILIVPAVNESLGRPVIFRNTEPRHLDLRLVDIVMASAAAPLYFPLHRIHGHRYADGGLVANAPALLASAELTRTFSVPANRQKVVSIGTTLTSPMSGVSDTRHDWWGGLRWIWGGGRLQELLMSGQQDIQSELLAGLGPVGRLHLDMELSPADSRKVHMVKADAEARSVLTEASEACLTRISPEHRGFLDRILARQSRSLAWQRGLSQSAEPVLV